MTEKHFCSFYLAFVKKNIETKWTVEWNVPYIKQIYIVDVAPQANNVIFFF